jgi:hypothetical protein
MRSFWWALISDSSARNESSARANSYAVGIVRVRRMRQMNARRALMWLAGGSVAMVIRESPV